MARGPPVIEEGTMGHSTAGSTDQQNTECFFVSNINDSFMTHNA